MNKIFYLCFFIVVTIFLSCSDSSDIDNEPVIPENIESKPAIDGIRIAWDYDSMIQISDVNSNGYNGYARLIQLDDESLLCTYESSGNIFVKKSSDSGATWGPSIHVVSGNVNENVVTPDIVKLADNSVLICYNVRPKSGSDSSYKFTIRTVKSIDNGIHWGEDQLVYEASSNFENGCWEPSAIQLPSGEIQLFFSNENVYQNSSEQNISLLRSNDSGNTWSSTPEITSFRSGSRDGMPSPILLKNQNEIVYSIEDNGTNNQFKPYIIRNSTEENWKSTVLGNSSNRNYALAENIANSIYAGAPYLAQLSTGEVLMSYQGTENRATNDLNNADMKVAIGTNRAEKFNRKSTPFLISYGKSALWNSISVLKDDTVIALTTTNEYSSSNVSQVWMIKGHVLPEVLATTETGNIDGKMEESIWQVESPVFIGQRGTSRLWANFTYDNSSLYLYAKVDDNQIIDGNSTNGDGVNLYLDCQNKRFVAPGKNIFKIEFNQNSTYQCYEGENRKWKVVKTDDIVCKTVKLNSRYLIEVKIPWVFLKGIPNINSRIGFNLELREKGNKNYIESISSNSNDIPYTWSTLKIN